MQIYNVDLPQSVRDLVREQSLFIALDKPKLALVWYDDTFQHIDTLKTKTIPDRCPKAPESQYFEHLLVGSYRFALLAKLRCTIILDFKGGREFKTNV